MKEELVQKVVVVVFSPPEHDAGDDGQAHNCAEVVEDENLAKERGGNTGQEARARGADDGRAEVMNGVLRAGSSQCYYSHHNRAPLFNSPVSLFFFIIFFLTRLFTPSVKNKRALFTLSDEPQSSRERMNVACV